MNDISREFIVTKVSLGDPKSGGPAYLNCELEGDNQHKVSFSVKAGDREYDLISAYCKPGALLLCGVAYLMYRNYLRMCIVSIKPLQPVRCGSFTPVDGATYMNPNRGFWVTTRPDGEEVSVPLIALGGESYLPVAGELTDKRLEYSDGFYDPEEGLCMARKTTESIFHRLIKAIFVRPAYSIRQ